VIHLLSPGSADQRTGGYRYNARMVAELTELGRSVEVHELMGDWPHASRADVRAAAARVAGLSGVVVADGLLWTALAGEVDREVVALVHSPLWREAGEAARAAEEAALARASHIVCTSRRIAGDLTIERPVTIVEPGTDPAPRAARPGRGRLVCVANVVPRKGHDVLGEAVRRAGPGVRVRCVGALDRDPAFAARVVAASEGLPVEWLGSVSPRELEAELATADALVSAARYEGFGMAVAEALRRGLPVVGPPAGVLDGRTGGHRLVPPDDPEALARALRRLVTEPGLADRLSDEAAALELPTWPAQARRLAAVLGGSR